MFSSGWNLSVVTDLVFFTLISSPILFAFFERQFKNDWSLSISLFDRAMSSAYDILDSICPLIE